MRTFAKIALLALTILTGCTSFGSFGLQAGADLKMRLRAVPGAGESFPSGFLWGVATAGYQYEGGDTTSNWAKWEASGRTTHRIGLALDSYRRWEEDLDLAKGLGLNAYRLSLEWARIEPSRGQIDPAAVQHYHQVLDGLKARGMEPVVTLSHFAYPAWLDSPLSGGNGGWESDETLTEYRRWVSWAAKEYGPQVKYWITINEPNTVGLCSYLFGAHPPGKKNPFAYDYVMEQMVKAHQAGYEAIHSNDPDAQVSVNPFMFHRRRSHPDYPDGQATRDRGLPTHLGDWKYLDRLTPHAGAPNQKRFLDYVAFDYYYSTNVLDLYKAPTWWRWPIYPEGMYEISSDLYERYHLPLLVAENGFATEGDNPRRDGWNREAFLVNHLAQLKRAMKEGVPVLGYMHWSLADNYEWGTYEPRFGLFGVDRRDPSLTRFKTKGAEVYEAIAEHNRIPEALLERYLGKKN
ncbi:MAG: glycoside hydrolase family 1 protein [Bacteroidota bacterium]